MTLLGQLRDKAEVVVNGLPAPNGLDRSAVVDESSEKAEVSDKDAQEAVPDRESQKSEVAAGSQSRSRQHKAELPASNKKPFRGNGCVVSAVYTGDLTYKRK